MLEKLFKKVPIGSDITIMNTQYQYRKKNDEGVYQPDYLAITYKDNETLKKNHIIIKNPKYKYYILKPGVDCSYNRLFVEKDKVDEVEVPYNNLEKDIAEKLNREADYYDALKMGDRNAIKRLHMDPRVLNSDKSIEDHYRFEFNKYYKNSITKLHKAFFDIEVDGRYLVSGDFPEPEKAEVPINAISLLDEQYNMVFTFLLRDKNNPLIEKAEDEWNSGKFSNEVIHNFIEDAVGGWKQMKRNKLENLQFKLLWFDSEIELLKAFFETVYKLDPDFIEGWNSSGFDLNYIIHRIYNLGYDPAEIMSDPNWEFPFLHHYIDQKNINDFAERGDYTRLACNPIWLDQMIQFCSRRKAKMGSFTSFKLDDIAWLTAKVHKLNYSDITTNISELPWLNYKVFILYNIMDVINQKCIENHTQDLDYIFAKCIVNNTTYAKGHRQTVYLINRMCKEWNEMGYIIGNNANKNNPQPEKYTGALVEDPLTTSDYAKLKINGIPIFVADNLIDFDFKSLYPSVMIENNIASNTQIGGISIWNNWVCKYYPNPKDKSRYDIVYIKDSGVAKDFPETEINNKKVPKKVKVYKDKDFTTPYFLTEEVEYLPDYFETVRYDKFYSDENYNNDDSYNRAGNFIEDLVADNLLVFCTRWLHLAGFKEFLEDWDEYNKKFLKSYSRHGNYGRFNYILDEHRVVETPFLDMGDIKAENPFYECRAEKPILLLKPLKDSEVNLNEYNESDFHGYNGN